MSSDTSKPEPQSEQGDVRQARWTQWTSLLGGTLGPLLGLVCVVTFFALADWIWADGTFFTVDNLRIITIQTCVVAIAALGMTIVIISKGIDLSAGTALALSATTLAWGLREDLAFLIYYGDNFHNASEDLNDAHRALEIARRDGDSAKVQMLQDRVAQRREALIRIAQIKLKTARQRAAAAEAPARRAAENYKAATEGTARQERLARIMKRWTEERDRRQQDVNRLEERIATLTNNPQFVPRSDYQWEQGVPNAPASAMLAVLLGVLTGMLGGLLNGVLVSWLRVVSFIVTLGTMTIFVGVGNWVSANTPIRPSEHDQVPLWLQDMVSVSTNAQWFGLFPTGVFLVVGLAVLLSLALRYSVFGRWVFAIGSNEATARLCGINVPLMKVAIYTLAGVFFGLAGMCHFAVESNGNPSSGIGLELAVIAAVVIGGGSLNGGRGAVLGTLAGVAIMRVIQSGCTHLELTKPLQQIILGAIIIGAVAIDKLRQRRLDE